MVKLKLKPEAGPLVDIGQGEYRRRFQRSSEPFVITDQGEAALLLRTGLFEPVSDKPSEPDQALPEADPEPAQSKPRSLRHPVKGVE